MSKKKEYVPWGSRGDLSRKLRFDTAGLTLGDAYFTPLELSMGKALQALSLMELTPTERVLLTVALCTVAVCLLTSCAGGAVTTESGQHTVTPIHPGISPSHPTGTVYEATATRLPTLTKTAERTPTLTSTPTAEMVDVNTSLSVNLDNLPVLSEDTLTLGALTQSEEASVEKSGFKFSSKAIPFQMSFIGHDNFTPFDRGGVLSNDSAYIKYQLSPEYVPYRGISANMVEIDGQKVLIMGFLWLNKNGTTSIIHLGEQDWKNPEKIASWAKAFKGEYRLYIIGNIYDPSYSQWRVDWGVDLLREKVLVDQYQNDGGAREDVIKKCVADNGNMPDGSDKYPFIGFLGPW